MIFLNRFKFYVVVEILIFPVVDDLFDAVYKHRLISSVNLPTIVDFALIVELFLDFVVMLVPVEVAGPIGVAFSLDVFCRVTDH